MIVSYECEPLLYQITPDGNGNYVAHYAMVDEGGTIRDRYQVCCKASEHKEAFASIDTAVRQLNAVVEKLASK